MTDRSAVRCIVSCGRVNSVRSSPGVIRCSRAPAPPARCATPRPQSAPPGCTAESRGDWGAMRRLGRQQRSRTSRIGWAPPPGPPTAVAVHLRGPSAPSPWGGPRLGHHGHPHHWDHHQQHRRHSTAPVAACVAESDSRACSRRPPRVPVDALYASTCLPPTASPAARQRRRRGAFRGAA